MSTIVLKSTYGLKDQSGLMPNVATKQHHITVSIIQMSFYCFRKGVIVVLPQFGANTPKGAIYYAIMHPVKSRYQCTMSQARRVILVIWCLSFVTAIPIIFAQIHLEVGERYKAYWCVRNWFQPWLWRTYEVYMLLLILIAPSMIMGFAYTNICHQLWVVVKDRANMSCGEIHVEKSKAYVPNTCHSNILSDYEEEGNTTLSTLKSPSLRLRPSLIVY
ncbi:g protein coupled receptor [Caerostris darwini]|uniref:G protein coupled receptor n=1 Tax=Caerostris darwini TaxID=1538125 RepID=A0AAV4S200_9ARAC|nr:g protein coupled receptor [Caerostris darwini]